MQHSSTTTKLMQNLRGGAAAAAAATSEDTKQRPSKRKKKKEPSGGKKKAKKKLQLEPDEEEEEPDETSSKEEQAENKARIEQTLKEKDAAEALGDAIRERAHQLRFEDDAYADNPFLEGIERQVTSLGWAMGASDQRTQRRQQQTSGEEHDDGAGVEAAPTSVLVHYFLKSHGGAHAMQCICSLLATAAGLGAMVLPLLANKSAAGGGGDASNWPHSLSLAMMRRCMLFAMVKHVSGLVAATFLTARAIPAVGLRKARIWMEELVTDPVSQYVFYAACILVWIPTPIKQVAAAAASDAAKTAAATSAAAEWWQSYPIIPALLVGPVVIRELVSTALVISDVLVLWSFSSSNGSGGASTFILKMGQALTNVVMSVLVTPKIWRSANAAERQAILAKLVSKLTLALELAVGLLMTVDAAWTLAGFTFAPSLAQRPTTPRQLLKRLFCTRLYLHFLWTRRRKISRLAHSVRGGATHLPLYVLQVLMDPVKSMGLDYPTQREQVEQTKVDSSSSSPLSWKDCLLTVAGLDNDNR